MDLNNTPISRNLKNSIRMLGLEIEDLFILGGTSVATLIVGQYIFPKHLTVLNLPMNYFCFFVVLGVGVPGLLIFKYGKPRGYLKDLIMWHLKPRSYSALERDREIRGPYILEECDIYEAEKEGRKKHG